jgi:hypothetical protein
MPKPESVNPAKFPISHVVFHGDSHNKHHNTFSIAYGCWEKEEWNLGVRWDGDDVGDLGYPKLFNNPTWFIIPRIFTRPMLFMLLALNIEGTRRKAVIEVLASMQ